MKTVFVIVITLLLAAPMALGLGGKPTLRTFAGHWEGHDRGLAVTQRGLATETIFDSCCQRSVTLRFRITRVWGTLRAPLASARVTFVHVYTRSDFTKKYPPPHVGEVGTLRIVKGVLHEPLGGDSYCNGKTQVRFACGA